MSNNATSLFLEMYNQVKEFGFERQVTDPTSPQQNETAEVIGKSFILYDPKANLVECKSVDLKWAIANVLHFFACTESAASLYRYNKYAERFLTYNKWIGAYGPIAMPQIERCINLLEAYRDSRRGVVHMGPTEFQDINRPCCWSALHFLVQGNELHMLVYQRSLNICGVMPYDCIMLTNILLYVAQALQLDPGPLHWTIGSLHYPVNSKLEELKPFDAGIVLPYETLQRPQDCWYILEHPETWNHEYNGILTAKGEMRT